MKTFRTIDLWTEPYENYYECFNGSFVDGFSKTEKPFDEYKIIKNCNCIISNTNEDINISNKHHAIVFYKNNLPVRLAVINRNTDIDKCINIALNQHFEDTILSNIYSHFNIKSSTIDMSQEPIYNSADITKEIDVGSCDRWSLLYNMLRGYYTDDFTPYGNFQSNNYEFIPNLHIKYELVTDSEKFEIEHHCAFINDLQTRLIPIQAFSPLTKK